MNASICSKQGYRASLNKPSPWRHLITALGLAAATLMAGCGGGGGGSDGEPLVTQTPARPLFASNAEAALKLTLEMMDLADALTSTWGLGAGINETPCTSGSGIGNVSNCVIGTNTFDGSVAATITESQAFTMPGESVSRTVAVKQELAITNLKWQSTKNRTTYTVNGNVLQTYSYPLFQNGLAVATITGTLTLTDDATGVRYQYRNITQRYSMTENPGAGSFDFRQTTRQGAIVYMDENLQYQLTAGNVLEFLALVGRDSTLSLFVTDDNYLLNIDTNADTNYDIYASIPVAEIGNGHNITTAPPHLSLGRQGGNDTPAPKDMLIPLTLVANDPDHNFYTLTWTWVATSPEAIAAGSSAGAISTFNQRASFTATVAGTYVITVTATDAGVSNAPLSASASITLQVAIDPPTFEITGLGNAVGDVGVARSFAISQQSMVPTTTTLLAAPAGMTLANNQLLWTPQRQFFPGSTETVKVRVDDNAGQSITNTFTVSVNDPAAAMPRTTPGLAINDFNTDATLLNITGDGSSELLMAGSGSAFFGLSLNGSTPTAVAANPYELSSIATNLMAIKPVRNAGVVSAYAILSESGVSIIDAATYAVRAQRGMQLNATTPTMKRRFAVADVNNDGSDEIIVLTSTANNANADQLLVLNQSDLSTLISTAQRALGQEFLIGNVDGDGDLEIVCGNGVILSAASLATEPGIGWNGGLNHVLANVDADPQLEIVEVSGASITVIDADSGQHTPIPSVSGLNADALDLFALNADGDAQDELLIGDTSNQVDVYSIDKSGATATLDRTLGTFAAGFTVREVMLGDVTASGTGNEVVFVSRNISNGGAIVSVVAPNGTPLIDGTAHSSLVGGFAAARPQNPVADSGFFTATTINEAAVGSGIAPGKGVLIVDASSAPAILPMDIPADAGLFAASADVNADGQLDVVASTRIRTDSDMSIFSYVTSVAALPQLITGGTPAPVTIAEFAGGNLDAVYIERTGTSGSESFVLVAHEVMGVELGRVDLSASTPVALAAANLDDDADPDIVLLETNGLRSFEYVNGGLEQTAAIPISGTQRAMAIGDTNNDGLSDIAVVGSVLRVFGPTLTQSVEAVMTQPAATLAFYAPGGNPQWLVGIGKQIVALDAKSLTQVWQSPTLNGQVNSVDVLTTTSGYQLRVGTDYAIYRSQP